MLDKCGQSHLIQIQYMWTRKILNLQIKIECIRIPVVGAKNMHPISKLCVFVSHCGIPKKSFVMRTFHHIVKFQNKLLKKCYVVHTLMFAVSTLYYNKVPV